MAMELDGVGDGDGDGERTSLAMRFKKFLSSSSSSSSSSSTSLYCTLQNLLLFSTNLKESEKESNDDCWWYLQDMEFLTLYKAELDAILDKLPAIWHGEILSTTMTTTDGNNFSSIGNSTTSAHENTTIPSKAQLLYQAHRTVANFLGPSNDIRFGVQSWTKRVSKSLLDSIMNSLTHMQDRHCAVLVLQALPREALASFVKEMTHYFNSTASLSSSSSSLFTSFIETSLNPSWCFESITIMIAHVSKTLDASSLAPSLIALLQTIVRIALKDYEVYSLVQVILLKSSNYHHIKSYEAFAKMGLSLFCHKEDCRQALVVLAEHYGDAYFINNGSGSVHKMISKALLCGMDIWNLSSSSSEDLGTLLSISKAVSVNLDVANQQKRKDCLQVAVRVAKSYGQDIRFNELDPVKNDESKNIEESYSSPSVSDPEDDSDDEFEVYLENNSNTRRIHLYYLADCLNKLRKACAEKHDGNEDVFEGFQEMLESIPNIIKSDPADGREICPALIVELLRAPYAPSVPNFEFLRDAAVLACLFKYPLVAIPVVVTYLKAESSTVGDKILGLTLLSKTAEDIMKSKVGDTVKTDKSVTQGSPTTATSLNVDSVKQMSNEPSKVVIKRPKKLQLLNDSSNATVYKSRVEIIRLIFFPIRDILATLLGPVINSDSGSKIVTVTDSIRSPKVQMAAVDQFDGIDVLVPTQAFLTLAVLCRISINTNVQRQVYTDTMQLCLLYKMSLSSNLRTAVMVALGSAMESWSHVKKRVSSSLGSNAGSGLIGQISDIEVQDDTLAMSVADFSSHAIKEESNQVCRDALSGILHCAIETFEIER